MKRYVLIIFLLTSLQLANTQSDINTGYYEQVSLITDRNIYVAGEKIWFAVQCTDQQGITDSVLSKIIYVELYDQRMNSISKAKFRLIEGFATGYMEIPGGIQSGNYYFRAYTQFQRNYSSYFFSSTLLSVINPQKPLLQEEMVSDGDILIVPQGKRLIAEAETKIAVRITPSLSRRTTKMVIVDQDEQEIAQTKPWLNGLALMTMTPRKGISYFLKINLKDDTEIMKPVPSVETGGVTLRHKIEENVFRVSLAGDSNSLRKSYDLDIISEHSDRVFTGPIEVDKPVFVKRDQFFDGMYFLTLKKDNLLLDFQPVFIGHKQPESVSMALNKQSFTTRELVALQFNLPENSGKGVTTVSVTMAGSANDADQLVPWYIAYNPVLFGNYFHNTIQNPDSLMSQIDAIMILYSKTLVENGFSETLTDVADLNWLPETRDAGISGQVINKITRRPLEGIMVYASVIEDDDQTHLYKTSVDGRFYFTLNHLTGGQHIYLSPQPVEGIQMELLVHSDFADSYPRAESMIPLNMDSADNELLNRLYVNAQLNKISQTYITEISEKKDYRPIVKPAGVHTLILDDYIEMPVMSEVFTEIIPFVSLRQKNDTYYFTLFDDKTLVTYTDPLVTLDGIPVFNVNSLMEITPESIDTIELINRTCYIGDYTVNGIIRIRTNTNNFGGYQIPESSRFIEFQAITPSSYPVFPKHTGTDRNPDFRSLLYWNTSVINVQTLKFYTSDAKGRYNVSIRFTNGNNTYIGTTTFPVY